MTTFIGLDLAWTPHHETGLCILDQTPAGVSLVSLYTDIRCPRSFSRLCASYGSDVVVAIDAPLLVRPDRNAEQLLAKKFGKHHAAPYQAKRSFLQKFNGLAGPNLACELQSEGFDLDPARLNAGAPGRFALEVFPHPAHVVLFGLDFALKYKRGLVASRKIALRVYQRHLNALLERELPIVNGSPEVAGVLSESALLAKGRALKRLEDKLDAITCAYIAYHCWRHGNAGFEVFGCAEDGYIVVPRVLETPLSTFAPALSSP